MRLSSAQVSRLLPTIVWLRGFVVCLFLVINPACARTIATSSQEPSQPLTSQRIVWSYADLRLLDPPDAAMPEHDLLAVYLHHSPRSYIRLDFLDLNLHNQPDIYLALDFSPGGTRWLPLPESAALDWDVLLYLPAHAPLTAINAQQQPISDLALRLERDPLMDTLEISFNASALYPSPGKAAPPEIGVQVFVTPADTPSLADSSPPTTSYAMPPQPAHVLLAFWNTFPAYTPAQGLRRWDGAHTGPLGGRHGLSNLLRTASSHQIPLALVDIKTPAWLSALDYAGDLELVASFARRGLLLLPEAIPPGGPPALAKYSLELSNRFSLPVSPYAYVQNLDDLPSLTRLWFVPARLSSPITTAYSWGDRRLFPLPFVSDNQFLLQPDLNGLSLEARRWMVTAALSTSQSSATPLLVLGGDLTQSSWGNPQIARLAFDYIRQHPWMQPVDGQSLLDAKPAPAPNPFPLFETATLPPETFSSSDMESFSNPSSPAYPLWDAAAQSYLALVQPSKPADPAYQDLVASYQPQVEILLEAARWAANPQPQASCPPNADQDGQTLCLLASRNLYAVFDPARGALLYAFTRSESTTHQVIGPTSQLTFGLGDPSTWDPQQGLAADPQVVPGAFADQDPAAYGVAISADQITFRHPHGERVKTFRLLENGLRVEYQSTNPVQVSLPVVLDPWLRFYPGWGDAYQAENLPDRFTWRASPAVQVKIRTSARLQAYAFNETRASMSQVENPNQEFPPGHYLPFPLALVVISSPGDFWVELTVDTINPE